MIDLDYVAEDLLEEDLWSFHWDLLNTKPPVNLKKQIECFLRDEGKGLILSGSQGVGKTHLLIGAYKVLGHYLPEGEEGVSIVAGRRGWSWLTAACRETFSSKAEISWENILQKKASAVFFLLDDVSLNSAFEKQIFERIVEACYLTGSKMFITTNLAPEPLRTAISRHTFSRLAATTTVIQLTSEAGDYRNCV